MELDVVFFAAHPDDAELSCGGTIIKFVNSGKKVGIIDLTGGELGTRGTVEIRKREAKSASNVLKISFRDNLGIKDGNIENSSVNRAKIISAIRKYKPRIIFLPYKSDRHPDHQNANLLIKESAFYSGLPKIRTILNGTGQQPHRPHRNIYFMQTYTFEPSFIVDITNEFDTKMKAVRCYASQFYDPSSKEPKTFISDKKFIEYLEARAAFYGFMAGVKYGEPFFLEDKLKLDVRSIFEC
jgi:bacillithiol biosynthesis deacetylase BshB1